MGTSEGGGSTAPKGRFHLSTFSATPHCLDIMYDNTSLLTFLQSELQQLEVLAGAEDDEARALLQQLEHQMQVLSSPAQQQPLTDLQLAEQIDRFVLVCEGGWRGWGEVLMQGQDTLNAVTANPNTAQVMLLQGDCKTIWAYLLSPGHSTVHPHLEPLACSALRLPVQS